MTITQPLALLGGLTPQQFARRHWQKKPLLVRAAVPALSPLLDRAALFELAGREDVESRVVEHTASGWRMRRGPLPRRALPPVSRAGWTLLVQGADLHNQGAHELLSRFRFLPGARLDDLMISWASDGGGVGAHVDSYDVFLLQAQGQRRWRIGRQPDVSFQDGLPLKILSRFDPTADYLLKAGDMLYLPPGYAHEGVAVGECQTYSIGFRAPRPAELAQELLQRLAQDAAESDSKPVADRLYSDASQPATDAPGAIPPALQAFARQAVARALADPVAMDRALGEHLSEPKPQVWFESAAAPRLLPAVKLDRRSRMFYDSRHVFINGESWRAGGADARLLRKLADNRSLTTADLARASGEAEQLLRTWFEAGWLGPAGA